MTRRIDYAEEIRITMALIDSDEADDIVSETARRLSGGSDASAEHHRIKLWRVWEDRFEIMGPY